MLPEWLMNERQLVTQPTTVPDESWEAVANAGAAAAGGVAAVTCGSAGARDPEHVRAALWYHGDTVLHLDPPSQGHTIKCFFSS